MFDDLTNTIRENIRRDMREKFGLTEAESEKSSKILQDRLKTLFSEEQMKAGFEQLKNYIQDLGAEGGHLKDNFNRETINELIDKVGLSEETATRIKDFSFEKYTGQLRTALADLESRFDGQKIQDYLKKVNLEDSARDAMDNLNKLFKRDS